MWKLHAYDDKTREWSEIGQFQSLRDAAGHISKLERDPYGAPRGGLFFRFTSIRSASSQTLKFFRISNIEPRKAAMS
jgi:hypothetical protein